MAGQEIEGDLWVQYLGLDLPPPSAASARWFQNTFASEAGGRGPICPNETG